MTGLASPAGRPTGAAFGLLMLLITFVVIGVSGGMLWLVGYNYDGLTGGVVTKLHPSTFLIFAAFLFRAVSAGNPVRYAVEGAWSRPGSFFLILAALVMFIQIVARAGTGIAGTIDTFMPAALLLILMADVDDRTAGRMENLLHVLMFINAVLALVEFGGHVRIFPYRLDGKVFPLETRSAGLQGHPLMGAAITACYSLGLVNGARSLPGWFRLAMLALQGAALITFGGRAATVMTLAMMAVFFAGETHRLFRAGAVPILGAAFALFVAAIVPAVAGILIERGFFDALLMRFVRDGGSANARVEMFSLFGSIPFRDLLVGPDTGLVESLRRVSGLEWGIEQPIVNTLLHQGVMITLLMTAAMAGFLTEVGRRAGHGVWLPMLTFVIVMQTSESVSSKTTMLTKFTLMMMLLYRPRAHPAVRRPSASIMAGSSARVVSSMRPMPSNRFQKAHPNPKPSAI